MVSDLASLGLHKVHGALVDRRQPVRRRLRPPRLRSEERFDRLARAVVGGVARRQRRRRHHHPGRRGRRARAHRRRSGVALLHRRGRVITAGNGPAAPTVDTKEDGSRTRVNVAGRIKLGADPRTFYRRVAQPSLFLGADAETAARAARHLRRQRRARRRLAGAGAARDRHARLGAAGGGGPGSQQALQQLRRRAAAPHAGRRDRRTSRKLGQRAQGGRPLPRQHRHQAPTAIR